MKVCLDCGKQLARNINSYSAKRCRKCSQQKPKGYRHSGSFKEGHKINWIEDRSKLKRNSTNRANDYAVKDWIKQCKKRDKICQLKNEECNGYLEVHHIKRWADYPELRYELTNGITLCHIHHPRKKVDEKRLMPIFIALVANKEYLPQ